MSRSSDRFTAPVATAPNEQPQPEAADVLEVSEAAASVSAPPPAAPELVRTLQEWAPILGWPSAPAWVLAGALAGRPLNQTYTRSSAEAIGNQVRGLPINRPAER